MPERPQPLRPFSEQVATSNRLMVQHRPGTSEHERGLSLLQSIAEHEAGGHARWLLGAYFLQVCSRPRAHEQALYWLRLAADEGTPEAMDRLADLYLSGLGGEQSLTAGLDLQLRLADQGFRRAAWEAAYLIGVVGPSEGLTAASAYLRACALGHVPAYFSLGLRFLTGNGVEPDSGLGHALLRRAADGGYQGAMELAARVPVRADGREKWYDRLKANLHAAHPSLSALVPGRPNQRQIVHPGLAALEQHLVSIGHPAFELDPTGRARVVPGGAESVAEGCTWTWLCQRPRVATGPAFATTEECAHLINKASPGMRAAAGYRRGNSENEDAELASFNGRVHPMGALETDAVTRILESRVSTFTGCPIENLEPCSIICYVPGEEYKPHTDFFSDEQIELNARAKRDYGGQRIATFLLYLRAPQAGGSTKYPAAGVDVAGEDGMAVIHYNVDQDGRQDLDSLHAGLPIVQGEKWLWRSTLRKNSLYKPPA
ncbi:2OG-Fe(II) oxygenase [Luteimonas kalidii]|uniref:2OG-Fe(II) oxygenase n=1 Tax=Luteimonas kalidii TaxID=3042025 RepID=A0ABT6JVF5_9GAMM|nr:2OG-Fe(II) oxygenase [Luteimonas kalidii]MDH5834664.1 2OG-Fe(II) oxygenase [Luteimonas kalidii]